MERRVVVTGVGAISSIGIGAAAFWENLLAGKSGVRPVARFDPRGFATHIGAEAPDYKISEFVPKSYRKATKVMARDIELAVVAADDAFKDARLTTKAYSEQPDIDARRFGCNIGAGLINADLNELTYAMQMARVSAEDPRLDLHKWGGDGMNQLTPLWLLKYLPNMLACHVTIIHGLKGPSNTITCADASSHLAIGEAFRTIQRGKADLAICGGAESKVNPMGMVRWSLLKRLTETHNDSPETALRPFDENADGSVLGEGGGLLILEEYDHAKARGAKIYAELVGFGASQDVYKVTDPMPDGSGYAKAITKALVDANIPPAGTNLVIPCGIGIKTHDRAELNGLTTAFGSGLERVPLSPIKGQTGNVAAGSGIEAIAAVLSVHHGKIPPAKNLGAPQDGRKLNTSDTVRDAEVNVAISSVYSLGGQNAALVFRAVH
jgi:3-oxoacyl-[acyl-carrier-protein] synthase II